MSDIRVTNLRLFSKFEFCNRYNVGHTKFYKLLNSGQLKAVKVGSKTLIEEEEAERWMASLPPYPRAPRAA
jgi:excisionase family DNA binding protein